MNNIEMFFLKTVFLVFIKKYGEYLFEENFLKWNWGFWQI